MVVSMPIASTFVAMFTAHLLGDFIFQTEWMVERKRRIWVLILHASIVTLASFLLLGAFEWRILMAILLTHFVMDAIKLIFYTMMAEVVHFQ